MSSASTHHLGFPKSPFPIGATFTFKTAVDKLYGAGWKSYGLIDVEAAMAPDGGISADIAVALLENMKKSASEAGHYRVGEIVYHYVNGDLVRVA